MFDSKEFDTPEGIAKAAEKLKQWTEKQQELKSNLAVSMNNLDTSKKKLAELGFDDLSEVDTLLKGQIKLRDEKVNKINELINAAKE
mgnify:CR=1 FL=1